MKSFAMAVLVLLLIFEACSKPNGTPFTPSQRLLAGKIWKLRQSDTIIYDSSRQFVAEHIANLADCNQQLNYFFNYDGFVAIYNGCHAPGWDKPDGSTWGVGGNFLELLASTCPRGCGPEYIALDTIKLLTTDSLVVAEGTGPNISFYNGVISKYPEWIRSTFTR